MKPPGLPGFSQIPPQPLQPQASGTPQGGLILLPSFLGCSRTAWTPECLDFYPGETCSEGPQIWPSTNMGSTEGARFFSPAGLQDSLTPLQPLEFSWGSSEPSSTPVRPQRLFDLFPTLPGCSRNPCFHPQALFPANGLLRLDYPTFAQPHQLELHPSFLLLVSPNLPFTSHLASQRGAIGWTVSLPPRHSSPESEQAEQSLALVARSTNSPRQGKVMTHSRTGTALQSYRWREAHVRLVGAMEAYRCTGCQ